MAGFAILLESGEAILLESGDELLLETVVVVVVPAPPSAGTYSVGRRLGRGTWRAAFTPRGGGAATVELPATTITMGRVVDAVSAATVTLEKGCTGADTIREWQHELALYRYGPTVTAIEEQLAWAGPVIQSVYTPTRTSFDARDLTQWFERRYLRSEHDYVDQQADLATIFQALIDDALASDPSPNIAVAATATGIVDDNYYIPPDSYLIAADRLRALARVGLDYTAVGRTIRVGGEEIPADPIATLGDDHFTDLTIRAEGVEYASNVAVTGHGGGQNGWQYAATSGGTHADYGLVDRVFAEPDLSDTASLQSAADSRVALLGASPIYVTATLTPAAPVTFDQLIPGARLRVVSTSTDRPVDVACRLQAVKADVGPAGEKVTVVLTPLGGTV